jgi:RNA polymerase sigma factor (sigma-70 family)
MQDYIQIPDVLQSLDDLPDGRLKAFLSSCRQISQQRLSLDTLRSLYLSNKAEFINIVEELSLRGFSFHTEKPNNILPAGVIATDVVLSATENQGRFQRLDYQNLGLSGFNQRFKVNSDQFFHYVPLNGFQTINRNLDKQLLESELLKTGFEIKEASNGVVRETIPVYEIKGNGDGLRTLPPVESDEEAGTEPITINDAFPEERFWMFKNYCSRMGITYITDVTPNHMEEHKRRKGVSPARVAEVRERLTKLLQNECSVDETDPIKPVENTISQDETNHIQPAENSIDVVFEGNLFNSFKRFCREQKIQFIEQVTEEHLEQYMKRPGVGNGKVNAVKERLNLFLPQEENTEDEVPSFFIQDIFTDFKYRSFFGFCKQKGIQTIDELTKRHFEEYGLMRGVGAGKVKAVKEIVGKRLKDSTESAIHKPQDKSFTSSINAVFHDNFFRSFRKYCLNKSIKTIYDVTGQHLIDYKSTKGVGLSRVEAVEERLNQVLAEDTEYGVFLEDEVAPLQIGMLSMDLKIADVFMERTYTTFRNYCELRRIATLGQLTAEFLNDYSMQPKVGKKKYEDVLKVLSFYTDNADQADEVFTTGEIFESIQDIEVQALFYYYGFQTKSNSRLTIKEIEGKDLSVLKDEFEPQLLMSLSRLLLKQKTPAAIINDLKTSMPERDYSIIVHRYGMGLTLEETGKHFGVTRERVRQVAKKAVKKLSAHIKRQHFAEIVKVLSPHEAFITEEQLVEIVGSEYAFIVGLLKQEDLLLKYNDTLEMFFLSDIDKKDLKQVEEFFDDLPLLFPSSAFHQSLEEVLQTIGIENPSEEVLQRMFEKARYKRYGEVYSRSRLTMNQVLNYLFKHHIKEPLKVDEAGAAYLQELAKHHLDYDLGSTLRAIDARIRDAEDVILVDSATFMYFDSDNFDQVFISQVEDFLFAQFEKKEVVNTEEIYEHFSDQVQSLGIISKLHLYSLIRYYLDDKFIVGKGNTLNIFTSENAMLSREDRLIAFMKNHGGHCTKDQLLEVMKPLYKVDFAVAQSDKLIPWGTNSVILVENLKISKSEEEQLKQFFLTGLEDGFTTANKLYRDMMFERKLSILLRNKGIDEPGKLPAIIKLLLPKVKGHTNFLYLDGCKYDSFDKVIEDKFTEEASRQEIRDLLVEYGYKEMMVGKIMKRIMEQGLFTEVDFNVLYPTKKLNISEETLRAIKAYAEEAQGEKAYIAISTLQGYRRKLPPLEFRWNPFLLTSMLQLCGYRQIKKNISDYRYDKLIVVKEDSPLQTFEDLIVYILEHEFTGNMHEYSIYDYLMEQGILKEQEYNHKKVLPYEIRNSDKFEFDELGYVTLKQGEMHVV